MPSPSVTVVDAQSSVRSDIEKGIAPSPKVTAEATPRIYLVPSREVASEAVVTKGVTFRQSLK